MTKPGDLDLFIRFEDSGAKYYFTSIMNSLSGASTYNSFDNVDVLDIDMIAQQMEDFMHYCRALQRFRKLKTLFNGLLRFSNPKMNGTNSMIGQPVSDPDYACFVVNGDHYAFSLDEVEKYWNNRTLL